MDDKNVEKTEKEEVTLSETETLSLLLVAERCGAAETTLELRKAQAQAQAQAVIAKYSEGGKYEVTALDVGRKTVTRELKKA